MEEKALDRLLDMLEYWFDGTFVQEDGLLPGGSPNRCVKRYVLRDIHTDMRYVLEGVSLSKKAQRIRQAELLASLQNNASEQISAWFTGKDGSWGIVEDGLFWQCRKYIDSIELPRESYALDEWRGIEAASFLLKIQNADVNPNASNVFYITDYIHRLMHLIKEDNTALYGDLSDVLAALNFTHEEEHQLPLAFSHGDFHPGNILWGDNCINAVIDWEFCGMKPICYDAANMLGCIGMDNPDWLTSPMATAFIRTLQLPELAQNLLIKYIVALRFAWMREWWQAKDKNMIIQELDFMWLMILSLNK